MKRKMFFIIIVSIFGASGIFAQLGYGANTATIDTGPLIMGAYFNLMGRLNISSSDEDNDNGDTTNFNSSGFGIGMQYERQLTETISVAGRFAYMRFGFVFPNDEAVFDTNFSSFSLEGHGRYYPFDGIFFLDGMLGYANMGTSVSGTSKSDSTKITTNASRSYLKAGFKIGWRMVFGYPVGFVFEPSFGYSVGAGLGDTMGKRLTADLEGDADSLDKAYGLFERIFLIGGPRISLAFGLQF